MREFSHTPALDRAPVEAAVARTSGWRSTRRNHLSEARTGRGCIVRERHLLPRTTGGLVAAAPATQAVPTLAPAVPKLAGAHRIIPSKKSLEANDRTGVNQANRNVIWANNEDYGDIMNNESTFSCPPGLLFTTCDLSIYLC
jgi:hypothetical protein